MKNTGNVFICCPHIGDAGKNTELANTYCHYAVQKGFVPLAPHIYFERFLDESAEPDIICSLSLMLLTSCEEVWVFGPQTETMKVEIEFAKKAGIPIRDLTGKINTMITYFHRDSGNYKDFLSVIVKGILTKEMEAEIRSKYLMDGECFYPEKLFLPSSPYAEEGDWHEWLEISYTELEPSIQICASDLINRFRSCNDV